MREYVPPPAGVPAIDMRSVSVGSMRDSSTIVVGDINWKVEAGDYWVVAGLQGSGKSDFLLMTAGLMPPQQGHYLLFGETMPIFEDARVKERLRLGVVFETGQLFNHLTIWENIALPLRYHGNLSKADAFPEVQKLLKLMSLEPWAESTPGAISRNWQKRAGLARALMLQPDVLLVDNPLAGLDLRHMSWWMSFLDDLSRGHSLLQGRPLTLVVTTSDLRPWRGQSRCFATIRDQRFRIMGDWSRLEAATEDPVRDLLMPRFLNRGASHRESKE
jgi:ABC-type transporter Mla maintaining outer membrane lipid asymmetry ATPase subunit MlaF